MDAFSARAVSLHRPALVQSLRLLFTLPASTPLPTLQLKHVKRLGKQFSFGRQEDSHELYLRIMEAIEAVQVCGNWLLLRRRLLSLLLRRLHVGAGC